MITERQAIENFHLALQDADSEMKSGRTENVLPCLWFASEMVRILNLIKLKKYLPEEEFKIVELHEFGERPLRAIRTNGEIFDMRRAGVKFKIVED